MGVGSWCVRQSAEGASVVGSIKDDYTGVIQTEGDYAF
jgi:hypothetical protein